MGTHKLNLDYHFSSPFDHVYSNVLDMRKFGEHHPYMTEVKVINQASDHTEFYIKEKVFLLGFIPNSPEYSAKVFEVEKHRHIRYTSLVKGQIDLAIDFKFDRHTNGEFKMSELIELKGNLIFCKILMGMMKKSHLELFQKVGQR
jgi:hypothetical protein